MQLTTTYSSMQRALEEFQKCKTSIWLKKGGVLHEAELTHKRGAGNNGAWRGNAAFTHVLLYKGPNYDPQNWCCKNGCPKDVPQAFAILSEMIGDCEPLFESIVVTACAPRDGFATSEWEGLESVETSEEIYATIRMAWYELMGKDAPAVVAGKVVDPLEFRAQLMRKELLQLFAGDDPSGIAKFSSRLPSEKSYPGFDGIDFSKRKLAKIDFGKCSLRGAKFDDADLVQSSFETTDLSDASLTGAKLDKASFAAANLSGANFTGARLVGADFKESILARTVFTDADLSKCSFRKADLRSVDLTDCKNLSQAKSFKGAVYDETTKLPADFGKSEELKWKGRKADPHKRKVKQEIFESGEVGFGEFIGNLNASFDKERLKKALAMLKKDTFQLFAETTEDSVVGIVKSQTDPDLVYGCRLVSDGTFSCCTQNLNACGGLRGALCKHILVLVIGLAKAEQITTTNAAHWVMASATEKPALDRDLLAEVFLKYQGATTGDIDWRPTETIPEDYYLF